LPLTRLPDAGASVTVAPRAVETAGAVAAGGGGVVAAGVDGAVLHAARVVRIAKVTPCRGKSFRMEILLVSECRI
jgi:hypothetical protein